MDRKICHVTKSWKGKRGMRKVRGDGILIPIPKIIFMYIHIPATFKIERKQGKLPLKIFNSTLNHTLN